MEIIDKGVLDGSFMDFYVPTEFARKALFYSESFGHFICDRSYRIDRKYLNQFLMVYVYGGAMEVNCGKNSYRVEKNQIGLIDCRKAHSYYGERNAEGKNLDFYWFHFNGVAAEMYGDYLIENYGTVYSGADILMLREPFLDVIRSAQNPLTNEHIVSSNIHAVLSGLTMLGKERRADSCVITPALMYIHNHFMEDISSDVLAERCGISKSHFIRTFNRYVECTPHKYLILYRIRQAKRLLITTDLTVERIAEQCGFNSASHFVREFRSVTNTTPNAFRASSGGFKKRGLTHCATAPPQHM